MKFSKNVLDFLQSFSFDGIVLDWEYPSQNGGLPSDKGNFVLLLTKLRNILKPAGLLLVAAVGATENLATISYDIPGVSAQVDFINLMTYDMHAAWEGFTGIHAANKIGPGAITYLDKQLSVEACVKFWLDKGAPPEKLVVAIPTNGQSFTLADASKNGVMATTIRNGNAGEFTKEPGRLGYNEVFYLTHFGRIKMISYFI